MGTVAYVPSAFTGIVSICAVDPDTGELNSCTDSGGTGFKNPAKIVLSRGLVS